MNKRSKQALQLYLGLCHTQEYSQSGVVTTAKNAKPSEPFDLDT